MRAQAGLVAVSEAGADVVARADVLREARYGYVRAVRRTWCFSRRRFGDFLGEGLGIFSEKVWGFSWRRFGDFLGEGLGIFLEKDGDAPGTGSPRRGVRCPPGAQ